MAAIITIVSTVAMIAGAVAVYFGVAAAAQRDRDVATVSAIGTLGLTAFVSLLNFVQYGRLPGFLIAVGLIGATLIWGTLRYATSTAGR